MKYLLALLFAGGLCSSSLLAQAIQGPDFDPDARTIGHPHELSLEVARKLSPDFDQHVGKFLGSKKEHDAFLAIPSTPATPLSSAWQQVGSSINGLVSGRCKTLAVDPITHHTTYLATSSGGIWKTSDITAEQVQWVNIGDNLPTLGIGAIAIDPKDPNTIYVGTGPHPGSEHNPYGVGFFRSTDAGLNWTQLADESVMGNRCAAIVIDPTNTKRIYVATGWQTFSTDHGIVRTTDGGVNWEELQINDTSFSATSFVMDPADPMTLYTGGYLGGIYRSHDGGDSWTLCKTGLPTTSGRTQLAIAPSNPNTIYASIAKAGDRAATLGLYRSDDRGLSWKRVNACNTDDPNSTHANYLSHQGNIMNSIVIDPHDASHVFVGGLDIHASNDSGKTLRHLTMWDISPDNFGLDNFVHGDIQSLLFVGDTLYACTDGGVARSTDMGVTWTKTMNDGLSTLQLNGVDCDQDMTFFVGGSQDNGNERIEAGSTLWQQSRVGDGGKVWVSPSDPSLVYSTHIYADFRKSVDSGKSWLISSGSGYGNFVTNQDFLSEGTFTFYPPFDVSADGQVIVMPGFFHIYVSKDGGEDGFAQESQSDIGLILDVAVSQNDPNKMWACGLGFTYYSTDMGLHWDTVSINNADAGIHVIQADPYHDNVIYTIFYGFETQLHKSTDGGRSWHKTGALSAPFGPNDMVIAPNGLIFVATGQGVIYSKDDGATWLALRDGLPTVPVVQLSLKGPNQDKLLAATFGRGAFWIDINGLKSGVPLPSPSNISFDPINPNPCNAESQTELRFTTNKAGQAEIALYDILGRSIKTLARDYYYAGSHSVNVSLVGIRPGTYYAVLTAQGYCLSQKVEIVAQ